MEQTMVSAEQAVEGESTHRVHASEKESPLELFNSAEANALRAEIILTGRKLWDRQYVDGNGGNISVRLGRSMCLCTPTMLSKADLTAADICLSDLNGKILAGDRTLTSELLLHLEIYKANPRARPSCIAIRPMRLRSRLPARCRQTGSFPNTKSSSGRPRSHPMRPRARRRSQKPCCPLSTSTTRSCCKNHGVVCWADTVTHAEWLAEIMDTYCRTYLIAKQIGEPLGVIPDEKIDDILRRKQWMGLPDARMARIGGDPRGGDPKNTAEVVELVKRQTGLKRVRICRRGRHTPSRTERPCRQG